MSTIPVDKDEFDQVMRQIEHIGEHERHFNNLEADYRKLASTWLLAGLAACGFVLKTETAIPFDRWYLVIGVASATSIGIGILWMLDVKVYHRLLHAFFIEGILLERSHSWLQPVRSRMVRTQRSGNTVKKVQYFYFISIGLLLFIDGIGFCNLAVWADNFFNKWLACIVLAAILTFIFIRMSRPARDAALDALDIIPNDTGGSVRTVAQRESMPPFF